MAKDSRKDFVVATTANFFGISASDEAVSQGYGSSALNNFLDDGSCYTLTAKYSGQNVDFTHSVNTFTFIYKF